MEDTSRLQITNRRAGKRGNRPEDATPLLPSAGPADDAGTFAAYQGDSAKSPVTDQAQAGALTPFSFEGTALRRVIIDGDPWFVAADICRAQQLTPHNGSYSRHLRKLDDDEKRQVNRASVLADATTSPLRGEVVDDPLAIEEGATVWLVSEGGLYTLMQRSRAATTKGTLPHRFRRWVTDVVLPSIRKTGRYEVGSEHAAPIQQSRAGAIPVELPNCGRFIVTALESGYSDVRQTSFSAVLQDATNLDCQAMGCALGSIEAFWQKVQQMRMTGEDPTGGFAMEHLERAIRDGAHLGRHYLYNYSMRPREKAS